VVSRSRPRFLLQAGFLIGVAVITAALHFDAWAIAVSMAAAFGAVVVAEWVVQREVTNSSPRLPTPRPARSKEVLTARNQARNVPAAAPAREEYAFIRHLRDAADVVGDMTEDVERFLRKSFPERRPSE
jgi:hypothetical protein